MSLFIASLNSGSNGNCYYVGNGSEAVLVDAGISCRETERRMANLGLAMEQVKAIFISHEHTDHISGLPVLAKKSVAGLHQRGDVRQQPDEFTTGTGARFYCRTCKRWCTARNAFYKTARCSRPL